MLGGLLSAGAEPLIATFVEAVSEKDRKLLDALERAVEEKRRTRER
jgi:hypothetical protein